MPNISKIPTWAASVANSILEAVKQKDPFTFYHCCRVGRSARRMGKAMTLTEFEITVLEYSGLFHDIGKVSIADGILLKSEKLREDEFEIMKSHPEKSVDMFSPLIESSSFFRFLVPGVRYHHEKFDGSGYCHGLSGERIPLMARIISVVDTVDAMRNTRPYRKGLSMDVIKKELIDFSGTQFDKAIVSIYLESIKYNKGIAEADEDEEVIERILKSA